jgi:predicted Zn finger-like uncharacterized protein
MSDDQHLPITRCPHCKTAFRVRESQLTLRHGMVRCGACRGVFNAIQHLLHQRGNTITIMPASGNEHVPEGYVAAPAQLGPLTLMPEEIRASAIPPVVASPTPTPAPTISAELIAPKTAIEKAIEGSPSPVAPDTSKATEVGEKTEAVGATAAIAVAAIAAATGSATPSPETAEAVAGATKSEAVSESAPEPATTASVGAAPAVAPTETPNAFAEQEIYTDVLEAKLAGATRPADATERFEWKPKRARSPAWMSAVWTLVALALTALLTAQAAIIFRNDLAVRVPALRASLTRACSFIGCKVAAPERPSSIVIEGAEFQADPAHSGLYVFSATLKNRHDHAAAYPYLVMTLTGLNTQVLSRRVFTPQEFVPGNADLKAGLAGQSEVEFKLWIDASTISPVGFDVRTTYAPAS